VSFQWDAVLGATSYQVVICKATGCWGSDLVASDTVTGPSHSRTLAAGSYQFKVASYFGTTVTAESAFRRRVEDGRGDGRVGE
jgi:hypothetical protein